jgi:hypothetical protein
MDAQQVLVNPISSTFQLNFIPIVNVVGFFDGVNVHEPLLDQVFTPGEFVETRVDNLFFSPLFNEETFQVTVVDDAASATPPAHNTPANNETAIPTRLKRFIALSCPVLSWNNQTPYVRGIPNILGNSLGN